MKKFIMYIMLTTILLACKKEPSLIGEDTLQDRAVHSIVPIEKPVPTVTETVEPYETHLMNNCYSEMVYLKGTIRTKITELRTFKEYSIIYEIYLENVSGFGDSSRLLYTGGGKDIRTSIIGLERYGKESYGRAIRNVVYTSSDSLHFISSKEDGEYYQNPRGKLVTNYDIITETCK